MTSRVFQLHPDAERYQWLTLTRESDFNILHDFRGAPVASTWQPLPAEWITEGKQRRKARSDFPILGSTPTFSARAVDALLDVLVPFGELLPLTGEATGFFVYNVTRIIPALDEEQSSLVRFDSGGIMMVSRYVFHAARVREEVVFKVPNIHMTVFATEVLVRRAKEAGLTGFDLPAVWAPPPGA
jgi:hypothetical protein